MISAPRKIALVVDVARSAAQQAVISEALWRVMSRGGPQELTLRAVAAEAGCTTGLVTARFPNKRALLLHARSMLHDRTASRMRKTVEELTDPVKALERVLLDAGMGPDFDARIWLGYMAATLSEDELRQAQVAANRHFVDVVRILVSRIRPSWSSEQGTVEAIRIVALVTGLAALGATDPELYSEARQERLIRKIAASLTTSEAP